MKKHRLAPLLLVALSLPACMERGMIRTYPPGAKVTINDKFIGVTPTVYGLGRWDSWPNRFACRIEHPGYETIDTDLQTHVPVGRIFAYWFTGGILFLFKRPSTLRDTYEFELQPVADGTAGSDASAPSVEKKMRQLQDLYDHGLITEQEFKRHRANLLDTLGHPQ